MYYNLTTLKDKLNLLLDAPFPSSILAEDIILSLAQYLDVGIVVQRVLLLPPDQQVNALVVHGEPDRALKTSQVFQLWPCRPAS